MWLFVAGAGLLGVLSIASSVIDPAFRSYYVPSGSMAPTLQVGDRVLVEHDAYTSGDVRRGDVVVLDGRGVFAEDSAGSPADFIKRVIALPGDRVACCQDGLITVQPAGSGQAVPVREPHVSATPGSQPFCEASARGQPCEPGSAGLLVPEGRVFVLGDNRSASLDSRAYLTDGHAGTVPLERVDRRAVAVIWPLDRRGRIGGREAFADLPD